MPSFIRNTWLQGNERAGHQVSAPREQRVDRKREA